MITASIGRQAPAVKLAGTVLGALAALAMTFAGLMKIFNTEFRGDMADYYELFGAEFPASFFILVGLVELVIAGRIAYRPTRPPGWSGRPD